MQQAARTAARPDAALIRELEAAGYHPLWDRYRCITPVALRAKDAPKLWRWRELDPLAARAVKEVPIEDVERRATYNQIFLVVSGEGRSSVGDQTFEWSRHDVFTIPHWTWARHEAKSGSADFFIVTDRSVFEALDLLRVELQ